ncbi:MAG: serine hydrolase [Nitrospinae bacterium]|nr:serine hydrolase [Nitrospinota bacterium]
MIWWVVSAGPTTVYRTVLYNFSDIDDDRIFPQRKLTSAPLAFLFRENIRTQIASLSVRLGGNEVLLKELIDMSKTTAFLVIKDDFVVFEEYYLGYDRSTPSLSFSMAKSFLSILVGCAIADGYLKSVDQPVTDFVPELKKNGFASVTVKHLLQMTSGIDYTENDFPFGLHVRFYYTDHLEDEILKLKLREPPGRRFVYKSSDAFLLTLALRRALGGKSITEYMQERLWNQLGMEYDGAWSIDHAPDGLEKTGCCLSATARDFAKFGRLYLNNGRWDGRRIVPESWVKESTKLDVSDGSARESAGHLGQFLYINPTAGVIIVRLGKSTWGLSREEWGNIFMSLSESIRRQLENGAESSQKQRTEQRHDFRQDIQDKR